MFNKIIILAIIVSVTCLLCSGCIGDNYFPLVKELKGIELGMDHYEVFQKMGKSGKEGLTKTMDGQPIKKWDYYNGAITLYFEQNVLKNYTIIIHPVSKDCYSGKIKGDISHISKQKDVIDKWGEPYKQSKDFLKYLTPEGTVTMQFLGGPWGDNAGQLCTIRVYK